MQNALIAYFDGERNAGLVLTALGVLGLVAAALFFPARWGLRSFAITLGGFALIEMAIGIGLYARTGAQVEALLAQLGGDVGRFVAEEGERMARVQRNFVIIQYAEVTVIIVAAVVALAFKERVTLSGIALGFAVHAAVLLAFDIIAERRGEAYLSQVRQLGVSSLRPPAPRAGSALTIPS